MTSASQISTTQYIEDEDGQLVEASIIQLVEEDEDGLPTITGTTSLDSNKAMVLNEATGEVEVIDLADPTVSHEVEVVTVDSDRLFGTRRFGNRLKNAPALLRNSRRVNQGFHFQEMPQNQQVFMAPATLPPASASFMKAGRHMQSNTPIVNTTHPHTSRLPQHNNFNNINIIQPSSITTSPGPDGREQQFVILSEGGVPLSNSEYSIVQDEDLQERLRELLMQQHDVKPNVMELEGSDQQTIYICDNSEQEEGMEVAEIMEEIDGQFLQSGGGNLIYHLDDAGNIISVSGLGTGDGTGTVVLEHTAPAPTKKRGRKSAANVLDTSKNNLKKRAQTELKCLEPDCQAVCYNVGELRKHLTSVHDNQFDEETVVFGSEEAFKSWRESYERERMVSFIYRGGTKKIAKDQAVTYLICHRSGHYKPTMGDVSKRKRKMKPQGSCKMGGYCTAGIKLLKNLESGEVKMDICHTHYGHPLDNQAIPHLRVNPMLRNVILNKFKDGMTFNEVLEFIHHNPDGLEGLRLVDRRAVRNIFDQWKNPRRRSKSSNKVPDGLEIGMEEAEPMELDLSNAILPDDSESSEHNGTADLSADLENSADEDESTGITTGVEGIDEPMDVKLKAHTVEKPEETLAEGRTSDTEDDEERNEEGTEGATEEEDEVEKEGELENSEGAAESFDITIVKEELEDYDSPLSPSKKNYNLRQKKRQSYAHLLKRSRKSSPSADEEGEKDVPDTVEVPDEPQPAEKEKTLQPQTQFVYKTRGRKSAGAPDEPEEKEKPRGRKRANTDNTPDDEPEEKEKTQTRGRKSAAAAAAAEEPSEKEKSQPPKSPHAYKTRGRKSSVPAEPEEKEKEKVQPQPTPSVKTRGRKTAEVADTVEEKEKAVPTPSPSVYKTRGRKTADVPDEPEVKEIASVPAKRGRKPAEVTIKSEEKEKTLTPQAASPEKKRGRKSAEVAVKSEEKEKTPAPQTPSVEKKRGRKTPDKEKTPGESSDKEKTPQPQSTEKKTPARKKKINLDIVKKESETVNDIIDMVINNPDDIESPKQTPSKKRKSMNWTEVEKDLLGIDKNLDPSIVSNIEQCIEKLYKHGESGPSVLMYKKEGKIAPVYGDITKGFRESDRCIVLQTPVQRQLMQMFPNIIGIEVIEGKTTDMKLVFVMVVDDYREAIPVAWMVSDVIEPRVVTNFFRCLKNECGEIAANYVMAPKNSDFHRLWCMTFNSKPKFIQNEYDARKDLRVTVQQNFTSEDTKRKVWNFVEALLTEKSKTKFNKGLLEVEPFFQNLDSPNSEIFLNLFQETWAPTAEEWALAYRVATPVNTIFAADSFAKLKKFISFKGTKRLRHSVDHILKIGYDKCFLRSKRMFKGDQKHSQHLEEIRRRHFLTASWKQEYLKLAEENFNWYVKLPDTERLLVTDVRSPCLCKTSCTECGICMHMYLCSCNDFKVLKIMCEHIHFVHRMRNEDLEQGTETDSESNATEIRIISTTSELPSSSVFTVYESDGKIALSPKDSDMPEHKPESESPHEKIIESENAEAEEDPESITADTDMEAESITTEVLPE